MTAAHGEAVDQLAPREPEVLRHVAAGLSNHEIADSSCSAPPPSRPM